jgi:hypothetical protein
MKRIFKRTAHVEGTANVHNDRRTVRRSITIRRSRDEVEQLWRSAAIPGIATFSDAPGERGIEVSVRAPRALQKGGTLELFGSYAGDDAGESLSTALREFKARLETGEVPTTAGQPSGRDARDD